MMSQPSRTVRKSRFSPGDSVWLCPNPESHPELQIPLIVAEVDRSGHFYTLVHGDTNLLYDDGRLFGVGRLHRRRDPDEVHVKAAQFKQTPKQQLPGIASTSGGSSSKSSHISQEVVKHTKLPESSDRSTSKLDEPEDVPQTPYWHATPERRALDEAIRGANAEGFSEVFYEAVNTGGIPAPATMAQRILLELLSCPIKERFRFRNLLAIYNTIDPQIRSPPQDYGDLDLKLEHLCDCGIQEFTLVFGWQLPKAIEFNARPITYTKVRAFFANNVILSGSPPFIEATTCEEYVSKHWGSDGKDILKLVVDAFNKDSSIVDPNSSVSVFSTVNHIVLRMSTADIARPALLRTWRCYAEALEWVCKATCQYHGPGVMVFRNYMCLDVFSGSSYAAGYEGNTTPPEELSTTHASCWKSMFDGCVIAESHMISSERFRPAGLELSFDLMVELASVETYYLVRNHNTGSEGLILLGFYTALVPIQQEGDNIVWHFESIDSRGMPLRVGDIKVLEQSWLCLTDIDQIKAARCFVGMWPEARIRLGTKEMPCNPELSFLPTKEHSLHVKSQAITASFGIGVGPVNGILGGTRTYEYRTNRRRHAPADMYAGAILQSEPKVALVYDSSVRLGWLVPTISLLLHLCHVYYRYRIAPTNSQPDPIPFADLSPNGAYATVKALFGKGDLELFQAGGTDGDKLLLRQLLVHLSADLMDARELTESPKINHFQRKFYAHELRHLIDMPGNGSPPSCVKPLPGARSWSALIEMADSLLVCGNFGQAISSSTEPGCTCNILPEQKDLLVAHIPCLERLLSRQNKFAWNPQGPQARQCRPSGVNVCSSCSNTPELVLQTLQRANGGSQIAQTTSSDMLTGAAIFGQL